MAKSVAFISLKDHKDNFHDTRPKCSLINPAINELGKVSKVILDTINDDIRSKMKVNQWKNSQSVIEWFKKISNKLNWDTLLFHLMLYNLSLDK